jgi:hypothetical protein
MSIELEMGSPAEVPLPTSLAPLTFDQFTDLIVGIEMLHALAARLSNATATIQSEPLIQEATLAFVKTIHSIKGFLLFISPSQFHAGAAGWSIDLSSASVMARQVIDDTLSFFYLSQPNLSAEEKEFRGLVWEFHGITEVIRTLEFVNGQHPGLNPIRHRRSELEARLQQEPFPTMMSAMESGRRGRIRAGKENYVLHDDQIWKLRGSVAADALKMPYKILSNFAHFSAFCRWLMASTNSSWERSWEEFQIPVMTVAQFAAEIVEGYLETFPGVRSLLTDEESQMVENYRSWLKDLDRS